MNLVFSLSLFWLSAHFTAFADIPTEQQQCEQSRWAICQTPSGGFIGENGPCPEGTKTTKAFQADKDCSAAALEKAQAQASAVPPPSTQARANPTQDMSQIPLGSYTPFFLFAAVLLMVLAFWIRHQLRKGSSPFYVLAKLVGQGVATLGAGFLGARWAFYFGNSLVQNHDSLAGGLLGFALAILAFCVFGAIGLGVATFAFARGFKKPHS